MRHSAEGLFARHKLYHSHHEDQPLRFLTEAKWPEVSAASETVQRCMTLLRWSDALGGRINETVAELERSDHNVFDKLFFVFYDFQRRHTRETWFTDWIKAFPEH